MMSHAFVDDQPSRREGLYSALAGRSSANARYVIYDLCIYLIRSLWSCSLVFLPGGGGGGGRC